MSKFKHFLHGALLMILQVCMAVGAQAAEGTETKLKYLRDEAGILTKEQAAKVEQLLVEHNRGGPGKIFVVTIPKLPTGTTIELFASMEINKPLPKEGEPLDRVMLLVAMGDGRLRIETSKEVWAKLPDAACEEIVTRKIVPEFKEGKMFEGIRSGVEAISAKLKENGK